MLSDRTAQPKPNRRDETTRSRKRRLILEMESHAPRGYGPLARDLHRIVVAEVRHRLRLSKRRIKSLPTPYGRVRLSFTSFCRVIIEIPGCDRKIGGAFFELWD